MIYLLDTDTVSFALRGQGNVTARITSCRPSDLGISVITLAELRFGAQRKQSETLHQLIDTFIASMQVVPFGAAAADEFGRLGSFLAAQGTPIGDFDVLIAAHALTLDVTLVTNNTRHYSRVPRLKFESWA